MAILGGEFAMLILSSGAPNAIERLLERASEGGEKSGLAVQAKRTQAPGTSAPLENIPYELTAYSMDHPGIVQRLTQFLAGRAINVRALETRVTHAATTGLPLFSLYATIEVPAKEKMTTLRRELETLGANENIDIEVRPVVQAAGLR